MIIKVKKSWKDFVDNKPAHTGLSRRDFLARGLATGAMSVALPYVLRESLISQAYADTMACPAPSLATGAIAQIYSNGGPTMGARFMSTAQAGQASVTALMSSNYGVTGTNFVTLGNNLVIDATSPFGATLLAGPPGYMGQTGATAAALWKKNVLNKLSAGGHLGPFNQDDGAGQDTGLLGGMSPFKTSTMGKDLKLGVADTVATWAAGLPASSVSGNISAVTSAALAKTFSLTPAATGLTSAKSMKSSSDAANSIANALSAVLGTNNRKAASLLQNNAGCAFYSNAALADPSYGTTLFTPSGALLTNVTGTLTPSESAQLAAFYQSAKGVAGGVVMQFNGRDYHGQDVQTNIVPADIEEARSFVMFLAACEAAGARGTMMYTSNGQAIAAGTKAIDGNNKTVAPLINGISTPVNGPVASGDAGGNYNAGLIMFYDPAGNVPMAKYTGTIDPTNGNVKSTVGTSQEAMAGLYLSALTFVNNGTTPAAAVTAMQAAGVASNVKNILLF